MFAASFMVGQSDWLPMMMPTLISAMPCLPLQMEARTIARIALRATDSTPGTRAVPVAGLAALPGG